MPRITSSSQGCGERGLGAPKAPSVRSFESTSRVLPIVSNQDQKTTLDMLAIGYRVYVCNRPQTCGEVVRVMPMTGRVVVRLDPPHPRWRGTLRSFRPERLVLYHD